MKATVYKSTGSWYSIKDEQGRFHQARIKGVFKIDDITSTNPLAAGDYIEFEQEKNEQAAMITAILPRKNYINRQSPRHKHQHHIVAANLDQCIIMATLKEPRTSQGFIDRFLVAAEMYHVPPVIVLNKTDLYGKKEIEKQQELEKIYRAAGYRIFPVSVKTGEGLDALNRELEGKVTLISGHSGVGKSSWLNYILPAASLRTGDVSGWSGKGMHTTTFAEMFDLPGGGSVIDTPGIREFGLVDIQEEELSHYFPEMRERLNNCQFNNCIHINEPGCAVKQAVEQGEIAAERYAGYISILSTLDEEY